MLVTVGVQVPSPLLLRFASAIFATAHENSRPNYDSILYFVDPASPFMRAIVDLHDYVFIFLTGVLLFVMFILFAILRNNFIIGSGSLDHSPK